ncbi:MAG: methyltransferase domain-containing protein [Actinobacteria bacterium]|nr:methyltransferase domain-containing protein [Actinomycetota bacterium]MCG2817459.1 methyltransferase domain-containing protein [Actinomycetes bacterium]MBU4217942.1 methyltransferase domain-containing protein [Actinomycetota bacterium]MBU4360025.1 methyltransferase domain-containing protein [Actinomycetota bacterium]MBU4393005.1 methyltransferase domain-containing protein [Actinomycetota bacterium]
MRSGDKLHGSRDERVASCWGEQTSFREDSELMRSIAWAEHPLTERYINRKVTGDDEAYWVDWAAGKHLDSPVEVGLSLGSGSGYIERHIIDGGYSTAMEGVDISAEAVRLAGEAACGRPVTYRKLDLNRDSLEEERYDFVVSAAALHHVTNLEHCLSEVHRSLNDGGLLIMHEFVGPDRFQWTDRQLDLVNRVYAVIPDRYRHNSITGEAHDSIERKPIGHMIEADPSEAVRSSEVLGVVSRFFETVELKEIGGALLHPLLEGIIGNFDEGDPCDAALLKMIIALDDAHTARDYLSSDFVVLVGRKRKAVTSVEKTSRTGREKLDTISRQEEEILELNRRLKEAQRLVTELGEAGKEQALEFEALRRDIEALSAENEALKSRGPLRTLRFLRAKLRRHR